MAHISFCEGKHQTKNEEGIAPKKRVRSSNVWQSEAGMQGRKREKRTYSKKTTEYAEDLFNDGFTKGKKSKKKLPEKPIEDIDCIEEPSSSVAQKKIQKHPEAEDKPENQETKRSSKRKKKSNDH